MYLPNYYYCYYFSWEIHVMWPFVKSCNWGFQKIEHQRVCYLRVANMSGEKIKCKQLLYVLCIAFIEKKGFFIYIYISIFIHKRTMELSMLKNNLFRSSLLEFISPFQSQVDYFIVQQNQLVCGFRVQQDLHVLLLQPKMRGMRKEYSTREKLVQQKIVLNKFVFFLLR